MSMLWIIIMPVLGLNFVLQKSTNVYLVKWLHHLVPISIIAAVLLFVFLYLIRLNKIANQSVILIILFALSYGMMITIALNCSLDFSKPEIYESTVIAKSRNNRRIITKYQIEVDSFPSRQLIVDQKIYYKIKKGEPIEISTYQGLLGIPWSKTSLD